MSLATRYVLFAWGAVALVACGSAPSTTMVPFDGAAVAGDVARPSDLAARKVASDVLDAAEADAMNAVPGDGGAERGQRGVADAGEGDAGLSPHMCSAGHTCTANARCQRACIGGLIYRCSCTEGRFVCTGCTAVDGGSPDGRSGGGPAACGAAVAEGRRCDPAGSVCQRPSDGGQKLCACGDVGPDRLWICQ